MSLVERINEDIKIAMKAREMEKLEALRAVKAALLLVQTSEASGGSISEADEFKLLQRLVKQRKEAAEIFKQQNRPDLSEPELFQAAVIEQYLPKMMSEEEIFAVVKEIITQSGANSIKDMGKVMGAASKALAGKADNAIISAMVKKLLES